MHKLIDKISNVMMAISCISLTVCVIVNAYEIFARYLFGKSLFWIQDFTLLLMMWFIFPGIVKVIHGKNDIVVDYFVNKLPAHIHHIVSIIMQIVVIVFCILLFYYSTSLIFLRQGQTMVTSGIPLIYYTLAINVCCILLVVMYLDKLAHVVKRKGE